MNSSPVQAAPKYKYYSATVYWFHSRLFSHYTSFSSILVPAVYCFYSILVLSVYMVLVLQYIGSKYTVFTVYRYYSLCAYYRP